MRWSFIFTTERVECTQKVTIMKIQWKRRELTASLLLKEKQILLGMKIDGALAGFLNMPGGHMEESDEGPISGSIRECKEETNLKCIGGRIVAILSIWRKKEKKHITVYVVYHPQYEGRLKRDPKEFSELKWFPVANIPYDKMAPGDDVWLSKLLKKMKRPLSKPLRVCIRCGEDRRDVQKVSLY